MSWNYNTKGKTDIKYKPKIFFSCHENDFKEYYETIKEEIFNCCDCAIFYNDEYDVKNISNEYYEILINMNLLVIPVTTNLLTTNNRSIDIDLKFALERNIPILPLVQENKIEQIFSKKFGNLHFLSKFAQDSYAVDYDEKLYKYLKSILLDDALIDKIKNEFDSYIFLSYRKKDRKYVSEFVSSIHSVEEFRDIAIWYDEYLTPGVDFNESIIEQIDNSDLFTLLITPNILEEPNYVMKKEYPIALEKNKSIIAVEFEKTDLSELQNKYKNIKNPFGVTDEELFKSIKDELSNISLRGKDTLEHHYLIGLAYLYGVDVEVNYAKSINVLEDVAEKGFLLAQMKLVEIYSKGIGIKRDILKAIKYQKKYRDNLMVEYEKDEYNKENCLLYLHSELDLASLELSAGLLKDSRNSCWRVLKQCKCDGRYGDFYGEYRKEPFVRAYLILGNVFKEREDSEQSLECYEKSISVIEDLIENNPENFDYMVLYFENIIKLLQIFFIKGYGGYYKVDKSIEKGIEILDKILEQDKSINVLKKVAECYQVIYEFKLKYNSGNFEDCLKTIELAENTYKEIVDEKDTLENNLKYNVILLDKVKLYLNKKMLKECRSYLKVVEQFFDNIDKEDITPNIIYHQCECYELIMELECINNNFKKCNKYYNLIVNAIEGLFINSPKEVYYELLINVHITFYTYFKDNKANEKLNRLIEFSKRNENTYSSLFKIKELLYKKKLIDESYYEIAELVYSNGNYCDIKTGEIYRLKLIFIDNKPNKHLKKVKMSKDFLNECKYELKKEIVLLQLGSKGGLGTRPNPSPYEFVTMVFEDNSEYCYQRYYG